MIPVKGNATYLSNFFFQEKGGSTIRMSCFGISKVIRHLSHVLFLERSSFKKSQQLFTSIGKSLHLFSTCFVFLVSRE